WGDVRFDMMVGRNLLSRAQDRAGRIRAILPLLERGGTIAIAENIPALSQRLSILLPKPGTQEEARQRKSWLDAEERVYGDKSDARFSWGVDDLSTAFTDNAMHEPDVNILQLARQLTITRAHLDKWFAPVHGSYATVLYAHGLSADEVTAFQNAAYASLLDRKVDWHSSVAILSAVK
ncbi:MAG: hypothetical protein J5746_03210, partial [Victivallales bacterium]|nr:hypothetical protein [Victivallales bacterium]